MRLVVATSAACPTALASPAATAEQRGLGGTEPVAGAGLAVQGTG